MLDFSSPLDVNRYNNVHRRLSGIGKGRAWVSLVYLVILTVVFIIFQSMISDAFKIANVLSSITGDNDTVYVVDSETGNTIGILSGVLAVASVLFCIIMFILLIIKIVRLYAFRSLMKENNESKGASSLIASVWLQIVFSILLFILMIVSANESADSTIQYLLIIPYVGLMAALVIEISGFASLHKSGSIHPNTRVGYMILLVADFFFLLMIILLCIMALVDDGDAKEVLSIISFVVVFLFLIVDLIGWGKVRKPVSDLGESDTVPVIQEAKVPAAMPSSRPVASPVHRRFCIQCGSPVKENAKFCTNCGASVTKG